jgi:hypothetical protein
MKTMVAKNLSYIDSELCNLGFIKVANGQYAHGRIKFKFDEYWPVLEFDVPNTIKIDPLCCEQLGQPGLWKYVISDNMTKRRFDIPPDTLTLPLANSSERAVNSVFKEFISWAILTADQKPLPKSSYLPSWKEMGLSMNDFVIQYDRFIRNICLVNENQALALRLSLLSFVPKLDKPRLGYLRRILIDAQNRWRLVRITLGHPGESIEAEINFSGAPGSILRILIQSGLNVLSSLCKWLIVSVDLLADASLQSNIFETCKI